MAERELSSCYGSEEDTEGTVWDANKLAVVIFLLLVLLGIIAASSLCKIVLILCVPSMI